MLYLLTWPLFIDTTFTEKGFLVEYMNVVRNSLATDGTACTEAVQSADKKVKQLLKKAAGRKTIKKLFK